MAGVGIRAHSCTDLAINAGLLGSLYLCEASIGALVISGYHLSGQREVVSALASHSGSCFIVASILFMLSSAFIAYVYLTTERSRSKRFGLTVMMNLVTLLLVLVIGELAIRLLTVETPEGPVLRNTLLFPRNWQNVAAQYRERWERFSASSGVFVVDDVLGWTMGANRQGHGPYNETYFSSVEG